MDLYTRTEIKNTDIKIETSLLNMYNLLYSLNIQQKILMYNSSLPLRQISACLQQIMVVVMISNYPISIS